jgi:hypothetical protein
MSNEENINSGTALTIDKFEFFRFVLDRINIKPSTFCVNNGWKSKTFISWKQSGVPERAWGILEKEIKLINLTNFHKRCRDDIFFLQELQDEYIKTRGNC